MHTALLPDRGIVRIAGDGARKFLDGLLTADLDALQPGAARYAALLTPQGKIVADFLITEAATEDGGGFYCDLPRALAPTFVEKLGFYKLRAKVTVEDRSDALAVLAAWDPGEASEYGLSFPDPRLPALGWRVLLPPHVAAEAAADLGAAMDDAAVYDAHRIALGVPRGGIDFAYGDAFPHEADMDQFAGVDFAKGCYVGQEVVSRMQHRGTARTRLVPVAYDGGAPEAGIPVTAGDKTVGTMGSAAGGRGLALLRLDRVADALAAGTPLAAGGITLTLHKPDWARFPWPTPA